MKSKNNLLKTALGFATGLTFVALVFVSWVYTDIPTAIYFFAALLVVLLGATAMVNQKALREAVATRSVRYGSNALVTVGLVMAILVVVSFLNNGHYLKKDLTQNKKNTLSDQTIKVLKDLKQEVKLTVFVKANERDGLKGTLEGYRYYTKKLSIEYVDPDRDPNIAEAMGVKKAGTVVVKSGTRESRADEPSEEKLTNAILKTLKDKAVQVCFTTGHGEKSIDTPEPGSYANLKKEFSHQNYESKAFNLVETGKVPEDCNVLIVAGPAKPFFEKEVQVLREYLDNGGRALLALDPNVKGGEIINKDLVALLADWNVDVQHNLVLDQTSRFLNVNATVPMAGMYSKDHPITKDAQGIPALLPLTSAVDFKQAASPSLKTWWLVKSTPRAFAKSDFKEIASGKVVLDDKRDKAGPHTLAVALEGSRSPDKKPAKPTRLVVFGTSQFATNQWGQHGANMDLFMNAASWLADDESLISIRPKELASQTPTISEIEMSYVKFLIRGTMPIGIFAMGFLVWRRRRRL